MTAPSFRDATQARRRRERKADRVADRGYFKGEEFWIAISAGMTPLVPKPLTSNSKADGRFDKRDFVYIAKTMSTVARPVNEPSSALPPSTRHDLEEVSLWPQPVRGIRKQCTTSVYRRIARWEHEAVLDAMQAAPTIAIPTQ